MCAFAFNSYGSKTNSFDLKLEFPLAFVLEAARELGWIPGSNDFMAKSWKSELMDFKVIFNYKKL